MSGGGGNMVSGAFNGFQAERDRTAFSRQDQPAGFSGQTYTGYQQPLPQGYGQRGPYNTLAQDMSMGRLGPYRFGGPSPFGYTPAFPSPWQGGYASPATYGAKGMAPAPYGGFSGFPAARLPTPGLYQPPQPQRRPQFQGITPPLYGNYGESF